MKIKSHPRNLKSSTKRNCPYLLGDQLRMIELRLSKLMMMKKKTMKKKKL